MRPSEQDRIGRPLLTVAIPCQLWRGQGIPSVGGMFRADSDLALSAFSG
jgi:hypothetical protein